MKLLVFFSLCLSLYAELEINGHIDLQTQAFIDKPSNKYAESFTAEPTLELSYELNSLKFYSKIYAQVDLYDYTKVQKNRRSFARIDELYMKKDFEDDSLSFGKSIKFWGALELRNLVDGFNPVDYRNDLLAGDKLGVWNLSYSHYTQDGEFELIVKLYEQDQEMAGLAYVYYFFPEFVTYEKSLQTKKGVYRPSVYLAYSGTLESEYALDYAFIYENGYDSQRYFLADKPQNLSRYSPTFAQPTTFRPQAYLVNKFMSYNTLVVNATLIKLEALYVKVEDDKYIGDYSHIGLGVEHTIQNIYEEHSLGVIAEYYRYDTYEQGKYSDLELFELMQNDLFIGFRYTLNNSSDTAIVVGIVADLEYDEEVYYLNLESRLGDDVKLKFDYYYIEPSKIKPTAYAYLGRHQRVGINLAYYF